ncbi:DNA internalization-related competence protein ComEC/Rec2 [Staphylococcus sp. IVB6218]|nr:DNA internalization-related competence protein ComEC/Rec2 [Staphylococcus sp. IVB6218]UXR79415.1 DNA internalization-related competence protein ComEC/Rec2 [Staphylococcus sp. IVB6218]
MMGYYIESNSMQSTTGDIQVSDKTIHSMIHIESLPIYNGDFYHTTVTMKNQAYRLIFREIKNTTRQPQASFWVDHDCEIKATTKPAQQENSLPTLFTNQLDLNACNITHHITLKDKILQLRNTAIERLAQSKLSGFPYIIALVTGTTDYIPILQKQQLRDLGISHLFAVSGTHVAIMTGLLYMIGKRCPIPLYVAKGCILIVLPLFLIFAGNSPSAQRAVVMAILVILLLRYTPQQPLYILLISYIILSVYNPQIHTHIGFQFSYTICFLLLMLRDTYINKIFIKASFITSMISILGTIPISYQYFNELQWIGLISNIFFIPLYGFCIIPLSFLTILIALLCPSLLFLFKLPFSFFFAIHKFILVCLKPLIAFKVILPDFGELGYATSIVFTIFFAYFLAQNKRGVLIILTACTFIVLLICHPHHENRMTMIDVGQGDAILFETSTGQTVLIDTGGEREDKNHFAHKLSITDQKLFPYLKTRGIHKIDYLILTHPHADHMGELEHLAQRVIIENIVINPNHFDKVNATIVQKVLRQEQSKLWDFKKLNQLKLGDFKFQFLNCDVEMSDDPNEHSIVTLVNINQYKLLLMGDATIKNEEKLLQSYQLPKIDILKVGHHGSKTSSSVAFLETIKPDIALISVAKHNMYHLPSPLILDRFINNHIPVYSTADNHHVIITFPNDINHSYKLSHESKGDS